MELLDVLWTEKYRPKVLQDLVLQEDVYKDFDYYFSKKEIPNLLFSGPPGSGKSTLARIVCSSNGIITNSEDNLLEINGSAKETRGISFVQDVIEPFLKIPPLKDPFKVVFIDEADYLTDQSFHSLRSIIESYSKTSRFIFTVNYLSKVPEAIQSRCTCYSFKQLPLEFVFKYCREVLEKENVKYEETVLKYIIDNIYPDVRKIVNTLQRCSITGELKINKDIVQTNEKLLVSLVLEVINFVQQGSNKVNSTMEKIVQILTDKQDLEFRTVYVDLFTKPEVPVPAKIVINKFTNTHQECLVPFMHFLSMVYEIVEVLQKYKQMKK